jgi:site-specific DNA-cytosine methylase
MDTLWFTKSRRAQTNEDYETWLEGGVMPTLNAFDNGDVRTTVLIATADVIGSLQARDYKGVGNQYVAENKLIVSFDTQFGSNATTFEDMSPTLKASQQPPSVTGTSVRRLTPVECERLQGFPDDWTAGQSDTQRYKQMGNAVAVPVVEWLIGNICDTF